MKKVGRNEPCPCGSGKKYKNCHQQLEATKASRNKTYLIGGLMVLFVIIAALSLYVNSQNPGPSKPSGQAPAGKVWSEEHGHYH